MDQIHIINARHCPKLSEIIFKKNLLIAYCLGISSALLAQCWYLMSPYFPVMVHGYFLFCFHFSDHIYLIGLRNVLPMSFSQLFYWNKLYCFILNQWLSTFLWHKHIVLTVNPKIILVLFHNSNSAIIMNHNVNLSVFLCFEVTPIKRLFNSQGVMSHRLRISALNPSSIFCF